MTDVQRNKLMEGPEWRWVANYIATLESLELWSYRERVGALSATLFRLGHR